MVFQSRCCRRRRCHRDSSETFAFFLVFGKQNNFGILSSLLLLGHVCFIGWLEFGNQKLGVSSLISCFASLFGGAVVLSQETLELRTFSHDLRDGTIGAPHVEGVVDSVGH